VAIDGLEPSYTVLRSPLLPPPGPKLSAPMACRLWGHSGRTDDCVHRNARLPALQDGDWLAFDYAGAYTVCSASRFGGGSMAEPTKLFVLSEVATRDLGHLAQRPGRTCGSCCGAVGGRGARGEQMG
jgi:ornithine decarboxylase